MIGNVEVGCVDVLAGGAEAGVEGQRLVDGAGGVEPDRLRDAAVVGVEVAIAPLIFGVGGLLAVVPGVVGLDGEDVDRGRGFQVRGEVEAEGHNAVLVAADEGAVEVHLAGLADTFELDEDFALQRGGRDGEVFAVPGDAGGEVVDGDLEGGVLVPGVGRGDVLPGGVVVGGGVGAGSACGGRLL